MEPELQAVSNPNIFSLSTANIQEGARLNIDFWDGQTECCFVDVQVFNLYAQLNVNIIAAYRHHEDEPMARGSVK